MSSDKTFRVISEGVRQDLEGHGSIQLRVPGPIHLAHAALADEGGDFVGAKADTWAEGHVGYGNGVAILPPVGLSGTHNGRAGFAGSGLLSKAHVRMLSDTGCLKILID